MTEAAHQPAGPLLRARGVTRSYARLQAVYPLDLEVSRGQVLGLLGPNGAGKTTTLSMLAGVLAPSAGVIEIDGIDLARDPVAARRALGYLPERPPLYPELTVDEYLAYCARLRGLGGARATAAVDAAVSHCGLGSQRRRLLGNLSQGYRQRAGIAQAVIHRPPVVLLDEPTAGLDPIQVREIRALVRELGSEHAVVLSTHILPEVQSTCDRVAILGSGRLVANSTLDALRGESLGGWVRVVFGGRPSGDALCAIPGVVEAREVAAGCWRLRTAAVDEPLDGLLRAAVDGDWKLRELVPERQSLEELFVSLTCGDGAADVAP